MLKNGTIFQDKYEILDCLGEGGMGAVYKARQSGLANRVVALKLMHRISLDSDDNVKRFHREARALASLEHKNIVSFYHYGIADDGTPFAVMEYLQGKSLAGILSEEQCLDGPRATKIMKQVCSALAFAHKLGIIHRDLKPDNIVLLEQPDADFVKVLDFGLAKLTEASGLATSKLTGTGLIMGSPNYMSPEQARGEAIDLRSDIYSCGCILYELLTGEKVFDSDSPVALLYKHTNELPKSFSQRKLAKQCPTSLEAVCLKCLEKDPLKRYQSMDELSQDLESIETGSDPAVMRSTKSRGRRFPASRAFAGLMALAVLAFAFLAGYWAKMNGQILMNSPESSIESMSVRMGKLVEAGDMKEAQALLASSIHSRIFNSWEQEKRDQLLSNYFDTFRKYGKQEDAFDVGYMILDSALKRAHVIGDSVDRNTARIYRMNMSRSDSVCTYFLGQNLSERQWKELDRLFASRSFPMHEKLYLPACLLAKTHDFYRTGEADRVNKTAGDYLALMTVAANRKDIEQSDYAFSKLVELQKKHHSPLIRLFEAHNLRGTTLLGRNDLDGAKMELKRAESILPELSPSPAEYIGYRNLKKACQDADAVRN